MLDESLKRLRTDHLDLWQWHAVATKEQVRKGFDQGGVVKALTEAKADGRVRYVGFTGHTHPDVHLAVLREKYPFDACQLPLSAIEANSDAFVRRVLPERQDIAPLAMKALGGNFKPVRDKVYTVDEALRYALTLPVSTLVTGPVSEKELRQNALVAASFEPMTPAQMVALEDRAKPAATSNDYQPYRRWMSYRDGDAAKYADLA